MRNNGHDNELIGLNETFRILQTRAERVLESEIDPELKQPVPVIKIGGLDPEDVVMATADDVRLELSRLIESLPEGSEIHDRKLTNVIASLNKQLIGKEVDLNSVRDLIGQVRDREQKALAS